ncbi:peptidoglycan-binding domain-containing protein, partial [Staphylococcus epidermidis]
TAPAPKAKANLTVDGKWGPSTTRALQKALGTVVDGVIRTNALYGGVTFGSGGSLVIKALQKKIGANADGYLGPETIRKLQRYLG